MLISALISTALQRRPYSVYKREDRPYIFIEQNTDESSSGNAKRVSGFLVWLGLNDTYTPLNDKEVGKLEIALLSSGDGDNNALINTLSHSKELTIDRIDHMVLPFAANAKTTINAFKAISTDGDIEAPNPYYSLFPNHTLPVIRITNDDSLLTKTIPFLEINRFTTQKSLAAIQAIQYAVKEMQEKEVQAPGKYELDRAKLEKTLRAIFQDKEKKPAR